MKILDRLINPAPSLEAVKFVSKNNDVVWIECSDRNASRFRIVPYYRSKRIGILSYFWNETGELVLEEVEIFPRHKRFRNSGLGKRMVTLFIENAKKMEAVKIWGIIKPHDGTTLEYLLDWYARLGFTVDEVNPGRFTISMNL